MKAQIQMMETVVVLVIFFIIVGIGLIFYGKVSEIKLDQKLNEYNELNRIQIAQVISTIPELQCSKDGIIEMNCIDLLKLKYAKDVIFKDQVYYFDFFSYSKVSVEMIFPGEENWVLYDKQPEEYTSKIPSFFPISLYEPILDNYYFGIMTVEVYQ